MNNSKFKNQIGCFYLLGTTANMISFIKILKSKNINYKVILKANQRNQIIPEMNKKIIDILKNNNSEYKVLDLEKLNKKILNQKNYLF